MDHDNRINEARTKALSVFEHAAAAEAWLASPCPALGGAIPEELAATDEGLALVLRELGAIEYGLPV